jgi:hypothetical protein
MLSFRKRCENPGNYVKAITPLKRAEYKREFIDIYILSNRGGFQMADPMGIMALKAAKDGIEVLDKLGLLEQVLLKLKSNPDKAVAKLTQALGELNLGYTKLYNDMIELGSLSFSPDDISETRKRLKALRSGKLKTELASVKGSCARIDSIYRRYLTGWFSEVLTKAESKKIKALFFDLADMDGKFMGSAVGLSEIAQQHATKTLLLLQDNKIDQAIKLTQKLDKKLAPMTNQLSGYMTLLWEMQTELIGITRAI